MLAEYLAEYYEHLEAVRRRLDGEDLEVDIDPSELLSLREQVFHAAARDKARLCCVFWASWASADILRARGIQAGPVSQAAPVHARQPTLVFKRPSTTMAT